jgi:hypothetical protein
MNEEITIAALEAENRYLRHQLDRTFEEALRLRHKLEHIHALSVLALHSGTGIGVEEAEPDGQAQADH